MERAVKSVELTCHPRPTTLHHDLSKVLAQLPAHWEVTEDLKAAWRRVPPILSVYSGILYRGLNQDTGGPPQSNLHR
jgi:hypothetical protein